MATDRFFIAPYDQNSGLQTNVRPWLVPDEAFSELNNAYVFRGRVRKRFGSRWLGDSSLVSRLRIQVGTTTGGAFSGNVRTINNDSGMPTGIGQAFSVLNTVFTVYIPTAGVQQMLRSDGSLLTATYNVTTSDFNITATGAPDGTLVYFYPNLPVMALSDWEQGTTDDEAIIGFDTRYAYQYVNGWKRLAGETNSGDAVWTGDNSQFFWWTNWSGTNASDFVFYVTNFNENEPNYMRYFFNNLWTTFNPQIDATPNFLNQALILVPFKNRLVAFNTWEGPAASLPGTNYRNRARYSAVGDPLATNAWRMDLPNNGNNIDASTTEAIITIEFIKDRLIVFFERSTWEFVYTGNQAYPFTWQQINTELGAESTFSIVPFDKICLGVGNVGIHACNGSNVERIDQKIPDTVFSIHNADAGVFRVYGIRDYFVEMVYWTFPAEGESNSDFPYPRRILVYNYKTGTWAFNDDSITVFGYFQPTIGISDSEPVTWDSTTVTWDDSVGWGSGPIQSLFRQVIAGNQEGYTFICDADATTNAAVLQITNLTVPSSAPFNIVSLTITDHNLSQGDYVYLQGITGTGNLTILNGQIFQVIETNYTSNTFNFLYTDSVGTILSGTYAGGGLIARVSQISISTKEYNFYAKQGRNAYIPKVDFMVDSTAAGQIQVDFYVSTAVTPLLEDSSEMGTLLGTGTLDTFPYTAAIPFEANATRLWHPVYFQADGEVIQLQLIMNDAQMRSVAVWQSGFTLHAMCIYAQSSSYRFQ